jgi:very-short-patch-repair endonuclease
MHSTVLAARAAAALYGRTHVRWMVERGRWQRPAKGVIVCHSGSLTYNERLTCELYAQGEGSALAGLTAAALDGLKNFESRMVFILVPYNSTPRKRPGLVVKRSRRFGSEDVHPLRAPRRTRIARSIVDAAAWAPTELRTQAIIASGVQQGLVKPAQLDEVVTQLGNVSHRALITETIRDVAGGSLSEYEVLFARLCRRFGLPEPTRQVRRRDASGRWRYLDVEFDDYQLVVEIDGQQHMDVVPWWEDMQRNNEIVVDDGKSLLRFAGFALRRQPEQVAAVLLRFFATRTPSQG